MMLFVFVIIVIFNLMGEMEVERIWSNGDAETFFLGSCFDKMLRFGASLDVNEVEPK